MYRKGHAKLVIGGLSISALIYLIFQFGVGWIIFDAVEPELTGALIRLEGNMICPPELSDGNFEVCFSHEGGVIVDGNLEKEIILEIEEEICNIPSGSYSKVNVCTLVDFWQGKKLYITGIGLLNKKTIKISTIISYAKAGKYIQLLRFAKYIPK